MRPRPRIAPPSPPAFTAAFLAAMAGGLFAWRSFGEGEHGGGHADPFVPILLELAALVAVAMVGRFLAGKAGQPSVLGELLAGVALGNLGARLGGPLCTLVANLDAALEVRRKVWDAGLAAEEAVRAVFPDAGPGDGTVGGTFLEVLGGPGGTELMDVGFAVWLFSSLGVILLLFMVGLESNVGEMRRVGGTALGVALVGVAAPFALGWGAARWLLPDAPSTVHLFLGATLSATSVGITARVFKDLGKLQSREAKVILGAAVIDDVLGLIALAVVVGIVTSGGVHLGEIARIALLSFAFLGVVLAFGEKIVGALAPVLARLDRHHAKLLLPLALAFALAWLSNLLGLASIIGAFAAGLILCDSFFAGRSEAASIEELVAPLEAIFAPIFFVIMGMQVDLASFAEPSTLGLAGAFVAAAIAGKVVSGLVAGKGLDRLTVGIGMLPRGEVGLIFASIGKGLGVVTDSVFSAVVIMVIVTTLLTPLGLKWSLSAGRSAGETAAD